MNEYKDAEVKHIYMYLNVLTFCERVVAEPSAWAGQTGTFLTQGWTALSSSFVLGRSYIRPPFLLLNINKS